MQPQTVEAVLLIAADAISASRPGARGESLEHYVKRLESLEKLAAAHPGVEKVYALQAGREIRVIVKPHEIDDDAAVLLSHEIAREIERPPRVPGPDQGDGDPREPRDRRRREQDGGRTAARREPSASSASTRRRAVAFELVASEDLTIVDNRTGREFTLPIVDGTIRATDLRQIDGLMAYDPAYLNTASCRSAITFIDGDAGILRYRGYPIEQLAGEATFLETAYLLLEGELPTADQLDALGGRRADPHLRAHELHEVPRGVPLRRASDGDAARRGRGALDVLSGREEHRRC